MGMAFVHPAAALPLLLSRGAMRHIDGAALVAGTVGLDAVDYFARMSARPALHLQATTALPAGLVGALALFALAAAAGPGLARALPRALQRRVGPALARPLRERPIPAVIAGLVVGTALHLAWDALTERHGLRGPLHDVVPWRALRGLTVPVAVAAVLAMIGAVALAPRASDEQLARVPPFSPRALVAVVVGGLSGAVALAALRLVVLGGSVPDAMAAASGGAILGVALAAVAAGRSSRGLPPRARRA